MRTDTLYLTPDGYAALESEQHDLASVRRPALFARLHDALADGNPDDATLDEIKDEIAQVDQRTREIEHMLRHAILLSAAENGAADRTIHLGTHVVVRDATGAATEWVIVGSAEANPRAGRISNESPVGAALFGRKEGETVTVHTLDGAMPYTIVRVL
jgi:transcription elongation factor GreA